MRLVLLDVRDRLSGAERIERQLKLRDDGGEDDDRPRR
jgi:hypothetical protein